MARKPKKSPAQLSLAEYFGKWGPQFLENCDIEGELHRSGLHEHCAGRHGCAHDAIHCPARWENVREWWPFRLLREAADDGDAEEFKRLLWFVLLQLDAAAPEGVLTHDRWPRGRRVETDHIYNAWVEMGEPQIDSRIYVANSRKHSFPISRLRPGLT